MRSLCWLGVLGALASTAQWRGEGGLRSRDHAMRMIIILAAIVLAAGAMSPPSVAKYYI
jgi:hypothetical protein